MPNEKEKKGSKFGRRGKSKMSKIMKRTWAVVLSLAVLTGLLVTSTIPAEAAAKKYVTGIKVAKSKVTLEEGKNTKINVTVKVKGNVKKTIKVKSSSSAVKVKVGKVNVDEESELATQFAVMSIPTLIIFCSPKSLRRQAALPITNSSGSSFLSRWA